MMTTVSWSEIEQAIKLNPQKEVSLSGEGAASTSISTMPAGDATLKWLPGWTEDDSISVADGVALSLWILDPMYRAASPSIRRSMEMEEASFLLHNSDSAWKEHNGRVRGWIRKHLEEDLRLRAGGGDPAPDAWETIRGTKRAALLMDYICIVRGLRVALWWPDQKSVAVIPASDTNITDVVQFNCLSGRIMVSSSGLYRVSGATWFHLLEKAVDITWCPAASIPSIGAQTVAQIQERIAAIPGDHIKTGGRAALWNRLQMLILKRSLNGLEVKDLEVKDLEVKNEAF